MQAYVFFPDSSWSRKENQEQPFNVQDTSGTVAIQMARFKHFLPSHSLGGNHHMFLPSILVAGREWERSKDKNESSLQR